MTEANPLVNLAVNLDLNKNDFIGFVRRTWANFNLENYLAQLCNLVFKKLKNLLHLNGFFVFLCLDHLFLQEDNPSPFSPISI